MIRLDADDAGFAQAFADLVDARREADADVARDVAAIVARVRGEGDAALRDLTRRFDRFDLDAHGWKLDRADCLAAWEGLEPGLRDALELAAERIAAYHAKQKPEDRDEIDAAGIRLGARWRAVDAAGVYVPGGRAAYPSSVLMNALPARAAGVGRLVMVTPTPDGEVNPLVLAAAHLAGVDEIWRIGGAQAIAALAHGTERIAPVDVITGPGNAWVAASRAAARAVERAEVRLIGSIPSGRPRGGAPLIWHGREALQPRPAPRPQGRWRQALHDRAGGSWCAS